MTVADPNWSSVTLLMHCDDFVNTKTAATASQVGSPTIDTSTFLFGSGSLHCTPSNYLTFPDSDDWDLGTGNFTIEFCVRFGASPANRTILGQGASGVGWRIVTDTYGALEFTMFDGVNDRTGASTTTVLMPNTWYRVCIMRDGTYLVTLIDGARAGYSFGYSYNLSGSTNALAIAPSADVYLDEIRITKGVVRYDTFSYTVATEEFPNADHPQYVVVLAEALHASDSPYAGPGTLHIDGLSDTVISSDVLRTLASQVVDDAIYAYDEPIFLGVWDVLDTVRVTDSTATVTATALQELVRAGELTALSGRLGVSMAEAARALDTARVSRIASISDPITVAWALNIAQGSKIAEALKISEVLNYPFRLGMSITDTLRMRDALWNFFHFDIAETLTVQETVAGLAKHIALLNEPVTVTETTSRHFVLSVTAQDDAILDDAFSLKMIFRPQVLEQVRISALTVEPNGGVTTWAVNTRTGAVTEYENFAFNSFASLGGHYLGASANGLYALDGEDDAGTPTIAHLRSGYAQFGGSRYTSFKAAYLGLRGGGDIYLKLDTGDGKSYTYKAVVQGQQSTKVRLGKGLRARYFAFELITEGQDFDLDTIEFVPIVAQRRV